MNTINKLSTENSNSSWKDEKRYLWPLGLITPVFPLLGGLITWATGSELGMWFPPLFLYTILPLLDKVLGKDPHNPPEEVVDQLSQDKYYRYCVYAFVPLQLIALLWSVSVVGSGTLSWFGVVGLGWSIALTNGIAFNTAHELGHKNDPFERWLSKLSLAPTGYGHFCVEHNRGHHVRVATPEDPASSRYGESFYQFLPRTVIGGYKSAWNLEKDRLQGRAMSVWSVSNENLQAWAMSVVLFAGLTAVFGWIVLPFLLLQAAVSASLFEIINYVEHYGLCRQKNENGRYERCKPEHSWNSNHLVTNLLLYQLQRHSDHHANPSRSYQALRHFDNVPQLPSGYAGMVVLAYFPPLWRRVMDPKVKAHYAGDLSLANVQASSTS
ncbi:MAG: alkane 1-monooxygenase [Gammaproteobacteria bacterium]|jgi:alkane 1-monooxygenase